MADVLGVLLAFPRDGFSKTRDPRLDPPPPPARHGCVQGAFWAPALARALRWPEKPPQDWERFFCVNLAVKDAAGAEFVDVRVSYKRFAEIRDWCYTNSALRKRCGTTVVRPAAGGICSSRSSRRSLRAIGHWWSCEARVMRHCSMAISKRPTGDCGVRGPAARGAEVDEPNESLWTPEEFAAMHAAVSATRERKRQAAEDLVYHNRRRRNN